jgi:hypothetical protein
VDVSDSLGKMPWWDNLSQSDATEQINGVGIPTKAFGIPRRECSVRSCPGGVTLIDDDSWNRKGRTLPRPAFP